MRYALDTEFIERPGVLILISIGIVCEDGREFYAEQDSIPWQMANDWVLENVKPNLSGEPTIVMNNTEMRDAIQQFVEQDPEPEFWGYFCDYDWVVFCWLFGRMIDLPEKFPKYCMDLKQWAKQIGAPRESFPKQEGTEHNALDDARWNMQLWNHLHLYEHDKMLRALRFQVNAEATDHDASVTLHRFRAGG